MSQPNKIPVSIHLINTDRLEATGFDNITNEVIHAVNEAGENFLSVPLSRDHFGPFNVSLYYSSNQYPPKWRHFLEPVIDKRSNLAKCQNLSYSYVCFVGYKNEIFTVAGGYRSMALARFQIHNFGLAILVRIFKKNSKVVRNIQDRGLTGNLLGQTKFYRGDQRFSDENQFGKIFKQVQAVIDKGLMKKEFGFTDNELNRKTSACLLKESFQLSKGIDFDKMLNLIEKLYTIWNRKPNFSLNKVEHLSRRQAGNPELIEKLELELMDQIYSQCKKGIDPDVDFCHKEFATYLEADNCEVQIEKGDSVSLAAHSTFGDLITRLKSTGNYFDDDADHFKHSVLFRNVVTFNNDGANLTKGLVLHHLHGEFTVDGNTYFLIDTEWYKILPSFVSDLNIECGELLKFAWDTNLIKDKFQLKSRESVFNHKFSGRKNWYVFDTITPDNIEFADLMTYDDQQIHLIHVKKGFDNSIRDLTAQMTIAARRVQEDLRTGYKYIEEVERKTRKSKMVQLAGQPFPKGGLASLFKGKGPQHITLTLVFVDKSEKDRTLKDHLNRFNSNIAKFSLLELKRELNNMGFGFKLIQLEAE